MRSLALAQFSLAVRQRVDLSGQQLPFGSNTSSVANITDAELTTMIQGSISKVWDILILKHGDNYAWGNYQFNSQAGVYSYPLPFDFYKEAGVDLSLDATGQNWASIRPYTLRDRNLFSFPLQSVLAYAGWQNIRFQIQGNQLYILPQTGPLPGVLRVLYFQACPILVNALPTAFATVSPVTQGQLVTASVTQQGVTTVQVFAALNSGTSGSAAPTWNVPGVVTDNGGIIWAYQAPLSLYVTVFDGISGYEELVILDSCIKARTKQQKDTSDLMMQFDKETARITAAAANRQAGDPMVVQGGWGMAEGGPAYGTGFGPFGDNG